MRLAAAFVVVAILVTILTKPSFIAVLFGLKTDLEFLLAGLLAAIVSTRTFIKRLVITVLAGSAVVVAFGLLQIFVLPPDFLTNFGYGPRTIPPYQTITLGTDSLRFPSTLGGPNQLGTYLILPLCLSIALAIRHRKVWLLPLIGAGIIVLTATHSRSAWLGATAAVILTILIAIPAAKRRIVILGLAGLAIIGLLLLPTALNPNGQLQYYLLHSSVATHDEKNSDTEHAASLRYGTEQLIKSPLGHGLGTAGPATLRTEHSDHIIENYYLQIGYETGLAGLILFIGILATLVKNLWLHTKRSPFAGPVGAAIIGVSIVGIVLPSWTDSSTALIAWITAGAISAGASGDTHV